MYDAHQYYYDGKKAVFGVLTNRRRWKFFRLESTSPDENIGKKLNPSNCPSLFYDGEVSLCLFPSADQIDSEKMLVDQETNESVSFPLPVDRRGVNEVLSALGATLVFGKSE
jgi:hypothetical protein